jgi:hypothetical protein
VDDPGIQRCWLAGADRDATLVGFFKPDLSPAERAAAQILGVPGLIRAAEQRKIRRLRRLRSELV